MRERRVVIVVWDGLRPDLVVPEVTPTLTAMAERGTWVRNSYCAYPSETRVNATSLATGCHPGRHGIVGNKLYVPAVDPHGAVVTGDAATLTAIAERDPPLVAVPCLGDYLAEAGKSVVVVSSGSPGSAWLSNPRPQDHLYNRALVRPAEAQAIVTQRWEVPLDSYPATGRLDWQARVCTEHVWPVLRPDVTVCWLTDPDHTQHRFGLGAPQSLDALRGCDALFNRLLASLDSLGWRDDTNVIVTSDHGFTTRRPRHETDPVPGLITAGLKAAPESDDVIVSGGAIYLTSESTDRAAAIVQALQDHPAAGAIFAADDGPAAGQPGTMPLSVAWGGRLHRRRPDIQFSPAWWDDTNEYGVPGYAAGPAGASHGSTSPRDLRNTLILAGPDVRSGTTSDVPAGLIDLAPTVLTMLGLPVPATMDGRVLTEVLRPGVVGGETTPTPEPQSETASASAAMTTGGSYRQWLRRVRVGKTSYLVAAGAERDEEQARRS